MIKIDEILKMLSTDNPKEIQERGIELGKSLHENIYFIMPYDEYGSEKLWKNCAKIIISRTLLENESNIYFLFDWLKDMTTPGAREIYKYLSESSSTFYRYILKECLNQKINEETKLKNELFCKNLIKLKKRIEKRINEKYKIDIDEIFKDMYSIYFPYTKICVNSEETIIKAIESGEKIKCLDPFILPNYEGNNKGVWNGCAIILSSKTDQELKPYIRKIMTYLQDLNWPGSLKIFERLIKIKGKWFDEELNYMLDYTKQIKDECFYEVLEELKVERNKNQEKD